MKVFYPSPSFARIPLANTRVQAGFPSPADDFIERRLSLDELLIHHPIATFFVEATGTSMMGAGIFPGDILIVDRSLQAIDGDIVIAVLDGQLTVKRLRIVAGQAQLTADNPDFAPIELRDGQELTIWGVVTGAIHRYKR
jgi:DNA polymerase V